MNKLWDVANEIEGLSYKLSNLTHVLELIATDIPDPQSGATWAARSMMETLSEELEAQAENLLAVYKELVVAETLTKPKKK